MKRDMPERLQNAHDLGISASEIRGGEK